MHACDRRTDGQTDRNTTPKTALAYARAVKTAMTNAGQKITRYQKEVDFENAFLRALATIIRNFL